MIFKENTRPIYLQIADRICYDIMSGVYNPDDRMPSVREYAASVEVNANTVMRSYEYLSTRDIIYNRRGIGFFAGNCFSIGSPSSKSRAASRPLLAHVITAVATATAIAPAATNPITVSADSGILTVDMDSTA